MQFTIVREALIKPLAHVVGAADKKQAAPILSNVLVVVKNQLLSLTTTDSEIEVVERIPLTHPATNGMTTIPARKWMDICKALPEQALLSFELEENKVHVRSGRSRYVLAGLPAENFPQVEGAAGEIELSIACATLRQLFEETSFAMAHHDVRYYLNGVLLIFSDAHVRLVATDGHRLATLLLPIRTPLTQTVQIIVPRKAVLEMQRLFAEQEEEIGLVIGNNHLRAVMTRSSFVTKLIDGKFPNYNAVLPSREKAFLMEASRTSFRQALLRVCALFSDKYRGVGLQLTKHSLKLVAATSERDEVEDEIEISYQGPEMEIGLNAHYLLEYLSVIKTETIRAYFTDPDTVVLFEGWSSDNTAQAQHCYAVMPMRL